MDFTLEKTGVIQNTKRVLFVVLALLLFSWIVLYYDYDGQVDAREIYKFLLAVVDRLFKFQSLFPSLFLVAAGLFLLVLLSSASAWFQVEYGRFWWARFDTLLFFPSIIPVYIYGISFESHIINVQSAGFYLLPIVVATGNGLWWWWHRQFVNRLKTIRQEKPTLGVANLGLSANRFYVLPEYKRSVWERVPEMFLWVLVNALFLEAAIPRISGVLYQLVLSLSDGRRSVQWSGVFVAVSFIALTWLLVRILSDYRLRQPIAYSNWGLIRSRLVEDKERDSWRGLDFGIVVLSIVPFIVSCITARQALKSDADYWELVVLMALFSFMAYLIEGVRSYWLSKPQDLVTTNLEKCRSTVIAVVSLFIMGSFIAGEELKHVTWGFESAGQVESVDQDEDDVTFAGSKIDEKERENQTISKGSIRSIKLFFQFWLFGILGLTTYLVVLLALFIFSFSAHYSWRGSSWRWLCYRTTNEVFAALSRVPPYLLLVVTMFWLGYQTYSGWTKQFIWVVALFLVLLPTQLIAIEGWIEEASQARFLVARRSLGISALGTFFYLLRTRWISNVVVLVTFAFGLILLLDVSMIWLLDDRGTFTYGPKHWLDHLRGQDIRPYEAILVWTGYPIIMYLFVQRFGNRNSLKAHSVDSNLIG